MCVMNSLQLDKTTVDDNGLYSLHADEIDAKTRVRIQRLLKRRGNNALMCVLSGKPQINLDGPKEIVLRKGQKLDLSANIQAPDDAVLTWKFNNTPLDDARAEVAKTSLKATMSLSSVVKNDEGKYQLVIESPTLGKATGEWSLRVLGECLSFPLRV